MGILPSYINERFRTGIRASSYGLAYSLAVILPSFYAFYAFYQAGLATVLPFESTGSYSSSAAYSSQAAATAVRKPVMST